MTNPLPTLSEFMVETFSGLFVDTKHPLPEQITLEDVAHALAQTCRFGGHSQRFYSVAEHAVLVSRRLEQKGAPRHVQIAGLHHDDAEAYLGDIPRPMKGLLGKVYKILTRRMDGAIWAATLSDYVRIDALHDPAIKEADNWALLLEARYLLPSRGVNWTAAQKQLWGLEPQGRIITPDYWSREEMLPREAKALYLDRHNELTKEGT